jgi:hypothetical protein
MDAARHLKSDTIPLVPRAVTPSTALPLQISTNPVRQSFNEYVTYLENRTRAREKDCFAKGTPVWTRTGLSPTVASSNCIAVSNGDAGIRAINCSTAN